MKTAKQVIQRIKTIAAWVCDYGPATAMQRTANFCDDGETMMACNMPPEMMS